MKTINNNLLDIVDRSCCCCCCCDERIDVFGENENLRGHHVLNDRIQIAAAAATTTTTTHFSSLARLVELGVQNGQLTVADLQREHCHTVVDRVVGQDLHQFLLIEIKYEK